MWWARREEGVSSLVSASVDCAAQCAAGAGGEERGVSVARGGACAQRMGSNGRQRDHQISSYAPIFSMASWPSFTAVFPACGARIFETMVPLTKAEISGQTKYVVNAVETLT